MTKVTQYCTYATFHTSEFKNWKNFRHPSVDRTVKAADQDIQLLMDPCSFEVSKMSVQIARQFENDQSF
jgi:hypothetical protein